MSHNNVYLQAHKLRVLLILLQNFNVLEIFCLI
jgi:hypothetical protein